MHKKTILALLALLGTWGLAQAAQLFVIKEDRPVAGSRVKPVSASANVPFDKAYGELDVAQQAIVRGGYESLPDSYEPPYPEQGLMPIYTAINQALDSSSKVVTGDLLAGAQVDETGQVQDVSFYIPATEDLMKLAAFTLMKTRFKPARCNGEPCAMEFPLYIDIRTTADKDVPEGHAGLWLQFVDDRSRATVVNPNRF